MLSRVAVSRLAQTCSFTAVRLHRDVSALGEPVSRAGFEPAMCLRDGFTVRVLQPFAYRPIDPAPEGRIIRRGDGAQRLISEPFGPEVKFHCCLVSEPELFIHAPPGGGDVRRGGETRTPGCRFWRPMPWPLGDAPMCSCCGVPLPHMHGVRATKKPTVPGWGLRWAPGITEICVSLVT